MHGLNATKYKSTLTDFKLGIFNHNLPLYVKMFCLLKEKPGTFAHSNYYYFKKIIYGDLWPLEVGCYIDEEVVLFVYWPFTKALFAESILSICCIPAW